VHYSFLLSLLVLHLLEGEFVVVELSVVLKLQRKLIEVVLGLYEVEVDELKDLYQLGGDFVDVLDGELVASLDHFLEAVVRTVLVHDILLVLLANDFLAFNYVSSCAQVLLPDQGAHVSQYLVLPLLTD
jgi:hypothetical protein